MLVATRACTPGIARAEPSLFERVSGLVSGLGSQTRGKVFDFLETVELFNAEAEIDRLVGSPWQLHDSTTYKLRLLPIYVTYPIQQQLVRQMVRLDELRSRRIQNVGPDAVEDVVVKFDSSAFDAIQRDFSGTLLRTFTVREIADLGVFVAAQQPLFPETEVEWAYRKRRIAQGKVVLATGLLGAAAAFNAAALSQSGTLASWVGKEYRLGWYGGFRQLGTRGQPQLRAGLTMQIPGGELAAGLWEQVRPDGDARRRALELALREGWLNRLVRPAGWDVFFECALRRVLDAEARYTGEARTGRAGLFFKREHPARFRYLTLRSSAEVESDFVTNSRFAVGLGFEHTKTGLATILQTSRSAIVRDGSRVHENRGGVLVAGTLETPEQFFVNDMAVSARLVREPWDALLVPGDLAEAERQLALLAERLARYLERRRLAYSVLRWQKSDTDTHGPLDANILVGARAMIVGHLYRLASLLESALGPLDSTRARFFEQSEITERLAHELPNDPGLEAHRARVAELDRVWKAESERVGSALLAYEHYRDCLRRMAAVSRPTLATESDPLSPRAIRKLKALTMLPVLAGL